MQQFDRSDLETLKTAVERFQTKYHLASPADVLAVVEGDGIPVTAFNETLSPLETVVKFLKENKNKRLSDIARILGKDVSSIWLAYKHASKKLPEHSEPTHTEHIIPFSALHDDSLSLLELITEYLRDTHKLSYRAIGVLLKRDERTVWTTHNRARNKRAAGNNRG